MRLLLLTASLWALALAKPEMYKESEDFQYSRSSTDEGSKSGYYGAQRGNMGGNYEKAHNMDSMAQHHMSTLVRQVDGELGDGANTKTGSVFTAGNSRGIYGSGNYDLSNLKGRNFGENSGYDDSQSQSSLNQNARYQGNSYATNNARYGGEQSLSSKQRSGYYTSNLASQYSNTDLESENKYHDASSDRTYNYGSVGGSNTRYYSHATKQAGAAYDQSNTNLHSTYDLNNQNRLITTPVKVYIRPGGRVAVPISAQTYALHSSALQDKNIADTTNVLRNSGSEIYYKPTNNAKHYESAYSYHKKWEKQDTQPLVVVPTENPFPANSELNEDRELDQNRQQYQSELDSSKSHLNTFNSGYSGHKYYQNGITSANSQSSTADNAFSNSYSANTKTASASQIKYQSEEQNKADSASSNAYSLDTYNSGTPTSNLNNLVEDINSRPKSYHSSFSYHKSWERRGDPYVITPSGDVSGQTSQKLTAASQNQGQFFSHKYGSHYNQKSYSNVDCDVICHQRRRRSYNMNQYEQDLNDGDIDLRQQSENEWDLGQQTENKFENLEDLGQATQNRWDNLENFGQQTQNTWNNLQNLGQETQNKWNNLEDNLGQQTQNNWDDLTDLGQQAQNNWSNPGDLGQQTENQKSKLENLGQETQNQFSNIEDLGQQTQGDWSKLENLGQHTRIKWDGLSQATLSQMDNLGQETQSEWDGVGQQPQNQWSKLEDLGQQIQTNWEKQQDFSQAHSDLEGTTRTETTDKSNIVINQQEKKIPNVERNESTNHKLLWDEISQMFEESPKIENNAKEFKNIYSGSLLQNDNKQLFEIEKLSIDKQPKDDQSSQTNKNEQKISTTPKNTNKETPLTDLLTYSGPKYLPDKQKHENTLTNPFEISQNQGTTLDQESENKWSNLDHQSEDQWSNLGQQSENQWSNLGQQSENHWSNLGQQSENQWSNLGQQSENHWSNLGQQSEDQWSNLGQQSENQWSNLGQQSENHWSNLGQQSENHWNNLGQQSENQWSNLDQQSKDHWSNLGQESENQWSSLDQQSENQWSDLSQQTQSIWSNLDQQSQQHFGQDKRDETKTETVVTHNVENKNLNEVLEYYQQVNNHHSNQLEVKDNDNAHKTNKDLITGGESYKIEPLPHSVDITSDKLSNKTIKNQVKTNLETSTEAQRLPELNKNTANIGRGDIGADDDSFEFGDHNIEQEKPNIIIYNIPSTTRKPLNNEHRKHYDHTLINPIIYKRPVTDSFSTEKQQEQNTDLQQEFKQQNLDLQQTQEGLSVVPDYKTVASPPQNSPIQHSRSLEIVPLEKFVKDHDLTFSKNNEFEEQETNHEIGNLELSTKKHLEIETPIELTTEKPGFWSSIWNKTKKAKTTVESWFNN